MLKATEVLKTIGDGAYKTVRRGLFDPTTEEWEGARAAVLNTDPYPLAGTTGGFDRRLTLNLELWSRREADPPSLDDELTDALTDDAEAFLAALAALRMEIEGQTEGEPIVLNVGIPTATCEEVHSLDWEIQGIVARIEVSY